MSLELRLIDIERRDPFTIAAMDQAILEECDAGRSPPTLVYHNWEPSVSIATNQRTNDLNLAECQQRGFRVVRVRSGGKAVIHFPDTEFSYSLFVPIAQRAPRKVYEIYCGRIGAALQSFGLPAVVADNNDIFVNGKKIGGNAQCMKKNVSMQHGLILYEMPSAEAMMRLMNPDLYPISASDELAKLLTGFTRYSRAGQQELREAITRHLAAPYSVRPGTLTEQEQARMQELIPVYQAEVFDETATATLGLCWLPAPAYLEKKRQRAMEARA